MHFATTGIGRATPERIEAAIRDRVKAWQSKSAHCPICLVSPDARYDHAQRLVREVLLEAALVDGDLARARAQVDARGRLLTSTGSSVLNVRTHASALESRAERHQL